MKLFEVLYFENYNSIEIAKVNIAIENTRKTNK